MGEVLRLCDYQLRREVRIVNVYGVVSDWLPGTLEVEARQQVREYNAHEGIEILTVETR